MPEDPPNIPPENPGQEKNPGQEESFRRYYLEKAGEYKRTVMQAKMRDWEEKNRQLGGRLFGIFGKDEDRRFFVFKQSITDQVPGTGGEMKAVQQFLVVTTDGFGVIEIDSSEYHKPAGEFSLYSKLWQHIDRAQHFPDEYRLSGYMSNTNFLSILQSQEFMMLSGVRTWATGSTDEERLKNARFYPCNDEGKVVGIVQLNIKQAEQDIIRRLDPGDQERITVPLGVAKKVDGILK